MSKESLQIGVTTNVNITDDLGNTLLDKSNAIHPQNMSRIISRALANEANSYIYKLALGRGGTFIDATGDISFRKPNDGIFPDAAGWQSQLHEQTYAEVVSTMGGLNSVKSYALPTGESQVVVTCILSADEPSGQLASSVLPNSSINGEFVFDELGLFSSGRPATATQGYQDVQVGPTHAIIYSDATSLAPNTEYVLNLTVDGASVGPGTFTTGPGVGGKITYADLINTLNAKLTGAVAQVTEPGVNTDGFLRFRSMTTGQTSSVVITDDRINPKWLLHGLGSPTSTHGAPTVAVTLIAPNNGDMQGAEDNSIDPSTERERLLTHLIFAPLQKDASRTWKITYKLTVVVQQSDPV